jgi:hypothetical protein
MYYLLKYPILAQCVYAFINPARAQDASTVNGTKVTKLSNGVTITKVEGVYRYKSGGVALFGYIQKSKDEFQPGDQVSFVVCNTSYIITVVYSSLSHVDQKCPTTPTSSYPETAASGWYEWKISSGKLVAVQKPEFKDKPGFQTLNFDEIKISDLPQDYRKILSTERRDAPAAVMFFVPNSGPLLGIVEPVS